MPKLTKRVVDALETGAATRFLWDTETKGFGFRVTPANARAFVLRYRTGGRERKFTIGRYGVFTVEQARVEAKRLLVRIADGADPVGEREEMHAAATVSDLLDRYLEEHVDRRNAATTRAEVRRLVEKTIRPEIGKLKVRSVKHSDVERIHRKLQATPRTANHVCSILSKAFSKAETWELRDPHSNPCRGIDRYSETKRERFLSAAELARLGAAMREAEERGLPWRIDEAAPKARHLARPENRRSLVNLDALALVRFLLLTGARLSEGRELRWAYVDAAAGTVALPGRKGGPRRAHPVSAPVLALLAARPRTEGAEWVFPSPTDVGQPIAKSVVEHLWQRLRACAGLEDVRLHDLRHTVGTAAGRTGANAFLVRDLLRHANVTMTDRYVNADADPIRSISNRIGDEISAALGGLFAETTRKSTTA